MLSNLHACVVMNTTNGRISGPSGREVGAGGRLRLEVGMGNGLLALRG